jgi:head-tail adaptor
MVIDPGDLRRRVYLQTVVRSLDTTTGGFNETWTNAQGGPDGKIGAAFRPPSASNVERVLGGQVQAQIAYMVVIRFNRSATTEARLVEGQLDENDQPIAGSNVFQIRGVRDVDDRHQWMELAVEQMPIPVVMQ